MKYAEYIKQIEIDSLWSGKRHVVWNLDRQVNILSGINGVGKSTILNKVVKGLAAGGEFPSHMLKGVRLKVQPDDAKWIRYDVIRSFDRPLWNLDAVNKLNTSLSDLATELDMQLFFLQRKYLDYQVNIGNRIIACLQDGRPDAALEAQRISAPKKTFQDLIDDLFSETGKRNTVLANWRDSESVSALERREADARNPAYGARRGPVALRPVYGRARSESACRLAAAAHRPYPHAQS